MLGEDWTSAVFRYAWPQFVGDPRVLKLVCTSAPEHKIQRVVRLGVVSRGHYYLRHSLLETAPKNQMQPTQRMYSGVGRALITRLVAKSYYDGAEGRLLIHPRPGTELFYRKLKFKRVEELPSSRIAVILRNEGVEQVRNLLVLSGRT